MKKQIINQKLLGSILVILLVAFGTQSTSYGAKPVNIPDVNLRMMIEDALGKASGETITKAEMETLTRFTANKGINDLEGLQFATNLTYLHLAAHYWAPEQHQWINLNEISDLSPLANLTKLTYINVPTNSNITDLSPLSGLRKLRELRLWNNNITDLLPLSGLIDLTHLDVSSNDRLSDLSPLSSLTNLEHLSLYYNDITDIAALSTLTNLKHLNLDYNNGIPDITPLANLTKLEVLGISNSNITDIASLSSLINLTTLHLADNNNLTNISTLGDLTNLWTLRLGNNNLTNISALSRLTNLRTLWLQKNNITDITPLSGLIDLRILWLQENNIADVSPLVDNLGFCDGGEVDLRDNPLSIQSINTHIPTLQARGVEVDFDNPNDPANEILLTVDDKPKIYNDNVFVLPAQEDLVTGGFPVSRYAEKFYTYFEDSFDFLILISNLDFGESRLGYFGQHYSMKNDIQGIGLDPYSYNPSGSTSKLQSVIHFTYYFAMGNGPTLHEVMHRWANYIVPQYAPHWHFTSANGQLGGFDAANLVDHGSNKYTAGNFTLAGYAHNIEPYSPIELYLAGFIPPEEVPDLLVAENGAPLLNENGSNVLIDGNPVFTASSIKTYTIEDIIAEHGSRVPDHSQSQRDFRAAAILLIDKNHPAVRGKLQTVSETVSWFSYAGNDEINQSYNFYEATGGRATMKMDDLSQLQKSTQTLQSIPVMPAGTSERSLTDMMDAKLPIDTVCEHPDHTGTIRDNNTIEPSLHQLIISEIMVASNGSSLPQWIELYNPSNADEINLKDWKLEIQNRQSADFNGKLNVTINFKKKKIKPQDTLLIVSKQGRFSNNFSKEQIYNLSTLHPNLQDIVLSEEGFYMKLSNAAGKLIDEAGNLDGKRNTDDKPVWSLPKRLAEDGARASMVRRYDNEMPRLGTEEAGWISATNTKLLTGTTTYYGRPNDIGAPGIESGGALPVTLSHFRAELTDTGVILKWTTESEVDNAGFYIYRSQIRDGTFKVVNPTLIQGAGTTSERNEYTWTDTTAKPNAVYYYRIEDISHAGVRKQLATVRMRGLVSAKGKLTTSWADLKAQQ